MIDNIRRSLANVATRSKALASERRVEAPHHFNFSDLKRSRASYKVLRRRPSERVKGNFISN